MMADPEEMSTSSIASVSSKKNKKKKKKKSKKKRKHRDRDGDRPKKKSKSDAAQALISSPNKPRIAISDKEGGKTKKRSSPGRPKDQIRLHFHVFDAEDGQSPGRLECKYCNTTINRAASPKEMKIHIRDCIEAGRAGVHLPLPKLKSIATTQPQPKSTSTATVKPQVQQEEAPKISKTSAVVSPSVAESKPPKPSTSKVAAEKTGSKKKSVEKEPQEPDGAESEYEQVFECERGCGYEHEDKVTVEKHESSCTFVKRKRGRPRKNKPAKARPTVAEPTKPASPVKRRVRGKGKAGSRGRKKLSVAVNDGERDEKKSSPTSEDYKSITLYCRQDFFRTIKRNKLKQEERERREAETVTRRSLNSMSEAEQLALALKASLQST